MAAEHPTPPPAYSCLIWGMAAVWTLIHLQETLSFLPHRGVTAEHQIAAGAMGGASIMAGFVLAYAAERILAVVYPMWVQGRGATARDPAGSADHSSDSAGR